MEHGGKECFRVYETERLILERTIPEEYKKLAEITLNKSVNFYYQRPVASLETIDQSYEFVKSQTQGTCSFSIKLKPDKIIIGQIGFYYTDYTCKEIGIFYYIGEDYQKRGYAGEAACPLIRHLFESLTLTKKLKIDYQEDNFGSQKVAAKIRDDIMKHHPEYKDGELPPFIDKYTMIGETGNGKVVYYFDSFDRQSEQEYPIDFFHGLKYFEMKSKGIVIMKK